MSPIVATLICILFIICLFWTDLKKSDSLSYALWIPLIWMFLAGSRYVSSWLDLSRPRTLVEVSMEGSSIDAAVFFLLIAAGVIVLLRRKIDWGQLLSRNKWIWLYFLYCGISIMWSDYPSVSLKRWIKELGNPIMVLVMLTEKHPYEAAGVILRRLAFLLLPLSILFIRYYPDMGRAYSYDGVLLLTGVGQQKNSLGLICLISGIYFSWNFLLNRKEDFKLRRRENITDFVLLGMVIWLLHLSQSATSLVCLVVTASMLLIGCITSRAQKPGRILVLVILVASISAMLVATLDVSNILLGILGRDRTLTSRTDIWQAVMEVGTNPVVGTGFRDFWTGDRLKVIAQKVGVRTVQAHNGYLEQYLNLGYIGVAFIGIIILSGLLKVQRHLSLDYPAAMLRLCFIVTAVLFNFTEASFYGINNMWLLLLLGVIEIRAQQAPEKIDSDNKHQQSG
jgi:exopolysaccharide production protein ExoQ